MEEIYYLIKINDTLKWEPRQNWSFIRKKNPLQTLCLSLLSLLAGIVTVIICNEQNWPKYL